MCEEFKHRFIEDNCTGSFHEEKYLAGGERDDDSVKKYQNIKDITEGTKKKVHDADYGDRENPRHELEGK